MTFLLKVDTDRAVSEEADVGDIAEIADEAMAGVESEGGGA